MVEKVNPEEESWFDSEDEELYDVDNIPEAKKQSYSKNEAASFDDLPAPKYSLGFDAGNNNVEPVTVKPKYSQKKYSKRTTKPSRDFDETPATFEELKTFNKQAENFIVWHLSQRDLTIHEARQKMVKKQKWPPETIKHVIDKCVQHKWLDDEKYVENFVRSEQRWNQSGKYAIKMKLIKKGVPVELIEEGLNNIDAEDETAAAKELLIKHAAKMVNLTDEKKTQRLLGLMSRKGYPASIAYSLVREIVKNPDIILDEWE
jgi:regulatory protein